MALETEANPVLLPPSAMRIRFHSVGGYGTIATGKLLTDILAGVLGHALEVRAEVRLGEERRADQLLHHPQPRAGAAHQRRARGRRDRHLAGPQVVHPHQPAQGPGRGRHLHPAVRPLPGGGLARAAPVRPPDDPREADPLPRRRRLQRGQAARPDARPRAADDGHRVHRRGRRARRPGDARAPPSRPSTTRCAPRSPRSSAARATPSSRATWRSSARAWRRRRSSTTTRPSSSRSTRTPAPAHTAAQRRALRVDVHEPERRPARAPCSTPPTTRTWWRGPFREGTIGEAPVLPGVGLFMPPGTAAGKDKGLFRLTVPEFHYDVCTGCMECALVCPDAAIPNTVHEIHDLLLTGIKELDVGEPQREALRAQVYALAERVREAYRQDKDAAPLPRGGGRGRRDPGRPTSPRWPATWTRLVADAGELPRRAHPPVLRRDGERRPGHRRALRRHHRPVEVHRLPGVHRGLRTGRAHAARPGRRRPRDAAGPLRVHDRRCPTPPSASTRGRPSPTATSSG